MTGHVVSHVEPSKIENLKWLGDSTNRAGAGGSSHQVILDFRLPILDSGENKCMVKPGCDV